jgi:hypothetical protein
MPSLPSQTVPGNGGTVSLDVLLAEIGQQAAAAANQLQQTAAGVMILPVFAQVRSETIDPLGQKGNLHFRRSGIRVMHARCRNDFLFLCVLQRHAGGASSRPVPGDASCIVKNVKGSPQFGRLTGSV